MVCPFGAVADCPSVSLRLLIGSIGVQGLMNLMNPNCLKSLSYKLNESSLCIYSPCLAGVLKSRYRSPNFVVLLDSKWLKIFSACLLLSPNLKRVSALTVSTYSTLSKDTCVFEPAISNLTWGVYLDS